MYLFMHMKYFRHLFDWDTEASPQPKTSRLKKLVSKDVNYLGQGNQIPIFLVSRKAMWDEVEFCYDFSSCTLAARFSS